MFQKISLVFSFLLICILSTAQRNLVTNALNENDPTEWLSQNSLHKMFPTATDRAAWEKVDKKSADYILKNGEKYLGYVWPTLPATLFLDYAKIGFRGSYEPLFFARREALSSLILAECIEGKGRFVRDIANGIWAICDDAYWGLPAHTYLQHNQDGLPDVTEPTVDFSAAETASLLAWSNYLLKPALDTVSPEISRRIKAEVGRRVLIPLRTRTDFWYLGFGTRIPNNWNPWVICNWMVASMLLDDNARTREADLRKMGICLDNFLNHYPEDGGCDEGPGYWDRAGGALFDCLEALYVASDGKVDLFQQPLIKKIGSYLHSAWIADDYFLNFADATIKVRINPMLVYRFGARTNNPVLAAMGAKEARPQGLDTGRVRGTLYRQMETIFNLSSLLTADTTVSYAKQFTLPDLQLAGARKGNFYFAAKGGHNDESHNHNDVGNFMLYYKNRPMLIDIGVEFYTAKTFSDQRYEIWTMRSAFHNVPYINGHEQKDGKAFRAENFIASHSDSKGSSVQMDITKAYEPSAGVQKWQRSYLLQANGKKFQITDEFQLSKRTDSTWTTLLAPLQPAIEKDYILLSNVNGTVKLKYNPSQVQPLIEEVTVVDKKLLPIWGDKIYRIKMLVKGSKTKDKITMTVEE